MSAKDFMGSSALASNAYVDAEDADPRVGLVNLADVMLVFACGLMLALVTYWQLDISAMTEVVQSDEMTEVGGIEDLENQVNGGTDNSFTQLGMVYEDPMTGKLYMLKEDVGESAAGTGQAGQAGQAADAAQAADEAQAAQADSAPAPASGAAGNQETSGASAGSNN